MKLYRYVGPKFIADRVASQPSGCEIRCPDDVWKWIRDSSQQLLDQCVIVTYVVNALGLLLIADRRSEHVACAGAEPILAAGEMTFSMDREIEIVEVSNQSTGYCPEPECWPAVAEAISRAQLRGPDSFTLVCVFRRCVKCGGLTLVKDSVLECGMCGADLPATYNVQ